MKIDLFGNIASFFRNVPAFLQNLESYLLKIQFTSKKKKDFVEQFSFLLNAGVAPADALEHMVEVAALDKDKVMLAVSRAMYLNVKSGKKVGDDLEGWFPYEISQIFSLADERGTLPEGIRNLVTFFKSESANRRALSAVLPGTFYLILISIFIAVAGAKLLPRIGEIVTGQWPILPRTLRATGEFIYYRFPVPILILLLLFFLIRWSLKNYQNSPLYICARPFLRLYKLHLSVLVLKSLSMLTTSGLAVSDGIVILLHHQKNIFLAYQLGAMMSKIRRGDDISSALDTGLLTERQVAFLRVIGKSCGSGEYAKIFAIMAEESDMQFNRILGFMAKILNVLFIIATTLGIIWIYGSYAMLVASVGGGV